MSFEDEYVRQAKKKNPIAGFLPAIGFILVIALGAIAYILSDPVHQLLQNQINNFPDDQEVGYVVGVVIFLVLVMIIALIYAAFAPKPPKLVSEKELKKEKQLREQERLDRKRRKRQIQKKVAEERRRQGR